METATLLKLNPIDALPHLNTFYQQYEHRIFQSKNLREWIAKQDIEKTLVQVTHQVNRMYLTDIYPSYYELVMVIGSKSGEFSILNYSKID